MEQLRGKVAVVTGAGSGIGRALAARLATDGMRVVATDIEIAALAGTAGEIEVASTFQADVSNADEVEALAEHTFETYGTVDVLCNNAGVFTGGTMWECSPSDFTWTLGVNLWGILHAIRAFVPRMIAQRSPAHIVNTVSMAGICSNAFSGPYTVSKFAALAATECLAHDLAVANVPIRVSAVVPGAVDTRIALASRNRPADLVAPPSEGSVFVEQALLDLTTNQGAEPTEVADLIVSAIRTEQFLVPTRPSYAEQIRNRADALVALELPPMPTFD